MAKHEGACPVATRTFILNQAERLKVGVGKVIESYAVEAGIPVGTIKNWVYPEQTKARAERQAGKKASRKFATPAPVVLTDDPPAAEGLAATPVEDLDKMIEETGAMYYAGRAISELANIDLEDPDRDDALRMVETWVVNQRKNPQR